MAGILAGIFKRASIENPRFNLDDPAAWDALDAAPSLSGVSVSQETALTYSPWWRGISMIARDVGKLPLYVYRSVGAGKERDVAHPAYQLLRHSPNEFQTALTFRMQLTGHALSRGNGYAYIMRDRSGMPLELLPLDPCATYPVRANGVVRYVTTAKGEQRKLDAADVLHLRGFGSDGLQGYSVIDKARDSLGLGMAGQRYQTVNLRNGARPGIVLEHPAKLNDEAKTNLRIAWERLHAGIDNAARTAILDGGLKANAIALSPEDAQLLQTRQFQIREVANWLGIPPHKLGDTNRGFASLEQENQSYLDDALDFWLCVWEAECRAKLLTEEEKAADDHAVEFVREAMLRADLAARSNYYRAALGGAPWMTRNEVRARENLNPVDGGDEMAMPLNLGQGGAQNDPKPGDPPPADPNAAGGQPPADEAQRAAMREAARGLLRETVGRMVRRVATHAERAAKDPRKFTAWIEGIEAEHLATFRASLAPIDQACRAAGGPERLEFGMADWLTRRLADVYSKAAESNTPKSLAGFIEQANPALEAAFVREAEGRYLGDDNGT